MPRYIKKQNGFSLIELSIVLVITALIAAAVLTGGNIIQKTKMQKVFAEVTEYKAAVNSFMEQYKRMPGDMSNALTYWGGSTDNGNGDGKLTGYTEGADVWHHLMMAGYITGQYNGDTFVSIPDAEIPGLHTGASSFSHTAGYFPFTLGVGNNAWNYGVSPIYGFTSADNVTVFAFGNSNDGASDTQAAPIFSPQDALQFDTKFDDGLPHLGIIMADHGMYAYAPVSNCTTLVGRASGYAGGAVAYDTTTTKDLQCAMMFTWDKR
jgi:prepilin-type N-terminal cleavage/methylation domain-containing protein